MNRQVHREPHSAAQGKRKARPAMATSVR